MTSKPPNSIKMGSSQQRMNSSDAESFSTVGLLPPTPLALQQRGDGTTKHRVKLPEDDSSVEPV